MHDCLLFRNGYSFTVYSFGTDVAECMTVYSFGTDIVLLFTLFGTGFTLYSFGTDIVFTSTTGKAGLFAVG